MRIQLAALLAFTTVLVSAVALAQSPKKSKPGTQPTPTPKPILTRREVDHRDWMIITDINIYGPKSALYTDSIPPVLATDNIVLDSFQILYPLMSNSSMHDVYPDAVMSKLSINKQVVDSKPEILTGYQGPTSVMQWEAQEVITPMITLHVEIPITSYDTRIDEDRAFAVPWPDDDHVWDQNLAADLQPQLFIEPGHPAIQNLLAQWTNGKPRKVGPYYLAKYLAGKVVEYYTPEGRSIEAIGRGATPLNISAILLAGFRVDGSVSAAENGRGSPLDAANLLTALYRAAGIPARLVIAYDVEQSIRDSSFVVRAWTEFYLYDPRDDQGEWIPVDIQNQRQFSNRAPPIDQLWQYFGYNEHFKTTAPLAYHWIPPANVTNAGPAALWGWRPLPANPIVAPQLSITVIGTPRRMGDGLGPS